MPSNMTPRDSSNPYADYSVEQMYAFLAGYELPRDIGATYEYSNLGMGLLGHALALKAGMSYEAARDPAAYLSRLGMRETAITLTSGAEGEARPRPRSPKVKSCPTGTSRRIAGAGALRSTARDMLTYLAANLDTATRLQRAMRDAHSSATRSRQSDQRPRSGLPGIIPSRPAGTIVWHNGGTGGYRSFAGFDPVRRVGVVVLSNLNASVDDIGFHLLDETFPLRTPAAHAHRSRRGLARVAALHRGCTS